MRVARVRTRAFASYRIVRVARVTRAHQDVRFVALSKPSERDWRRPFLQSVPRLPS